MKTKPGKPLPDPAPGGAPQKPSRRNVLSFGLIAAGAIGGAGYFLWPVLRQSTVVTPASTVAITISMSGFSPKVVTGSVGQEIRVQLINKDNSLHSDGGGWHQFAVDELGLDYKVAPLSESLISFTVDKPGTYDFYCGICCGGKANPYMHGQLVVEA
ncbi:MAG: cupredoxin domain-containing protein [Halocynthiibacter sp.]